MPVLVDTSLWVDYFRGTIHPDHLSPLIDMNLAVTNDLILAELIPFLAAKKQRRVIHLLKELPKLPMSPDWEEIIHFQAACLKSGRSGVGIPDLLIAQNAIQNRCPVYATDKHFKWLQSTIHLDIYDDPGQ